MVKVEDLKFFVLFKVRIWVEGFRVLGLEFRLSQLGESGRSVRVR